MSDRYVFDVNVRETRTVQFTRPVSPQEAQEAVLRNDTTLIESVSQRSPGSVMTVFSFQVAVNPATDPIAPATVRTQPVRPKNPKSEVTTGDPVVTK